MLHNPTYNFVDVYATEKMVYALDETGLLYSTPYTPDKGTTLDLIGTDFKKIIPLENNHLLITGIKELYLFDLRNMNIVKQVGVSKKITWADKLYDNTIQLFYTDGTAAEADGNLKITDKNWPNKKEVITAACYSKKFDCVFLGTKQGTIVAKKRNGETFTRFYGHKAEITDLDVDGDILVSTSFDKQVIVWNMPKLQQDSNLFKKDNSRHNDWITLMEFGQKTWPFCLSMCHPVDEVWIGSQDGTLQLLCYSVPKMSKQLKSSLTRELTPMEWTEFIGSSIPYENLLNP